MYKIWLEKDSGEKFEINISDENVEKFRTKAREIAYKENKDFSFIELFERVLKAYIEPVTTDPTPVNNPPASSITPPIPTYKNGFSGHRPIIKPNTKSGVVPYDGGYNS